jgi:glycogen operon protein
MIVDSLLYWVEHMHVDGFRFDLASILARDETGRPLENPPVLWDIESDPVLAGTKLIAEAWDAAGLYQVGSFIGLMAPIVTVWGVHGIFELRADRPYH